MKKVFTWFSALVLLGMIATGCGVEDPFDPIGGNVGLEGNWTIDGLPADAASCAAAGIANVELRLYDRFGSEFFSDVQHVEACAVGTLSTTARFRPGTYRVLWVATDASGRSVFRSGFDTITARDGDIIVANTDLPSVPPVTEFNPRGTEVTLSGEWQVNGAIPDSFNCAETNIATVEVVFYDSDGTSPYTDRDFTFACETGSFVRPNSLAAGAYKSQWRALDAAGGIIAEDEILDLVVSPGDATLRTPNFVIEFAPTLDMTLAWQGIDTFTSCAEATVGTFDYDLRDSTGATVSTMTGLGCTESLEFSDIAPGTYQLDVIGYFTDGSQGWASICDSLVVDATGRSEYICNVGATTPTLDVTISWQTSPGGGHGTCDEAGVTSFSYWLAVSGSAETISSMIGIGCTELLSFEGLDPGEYTLSFDAMVGAAKYGGDCDMLVTSFGIEEYNCFVDLE